MDGHCLSSHSYLCKDIEAQSWECGDPELWRHHSQRQVPSVLVQTVSLR